MSKIILSYVSKLENIILRYYDIMKVRYDLCMCGLVIFLLSDPPYLFCSVSFNSIPEMHAAENCVYIGGYTSAI